MHAFQINVIPQPDSLGGGWVAEFRYENGHTLAVERGDTALKATNAVLAAPTVATILNEAKD